MENFKTGPKYQTLKILQVEPAACLSWSYCKDSEQIMFRGLLLLFAVLGSYFTSAISQAGDVVESAVPDSVVGPDFAVFCQVAKNEWRRVINHNDKGANVLPQSFTFEKE